MPSNQVFVITKLLSKLFTNDTGRFPVRAHSVNQYVMIAFHTDGNLILQQAFKSKSNRHRIAAYNTIMTRLAARGLSADLQIMDNRTNSAYIEAITFKWNTTFQLVLSDMHCHNQAERAICMFKDPFLTNPGWCQFSLSTLPLGPPSPTSQAYAQSPPTGHSQPSNQCMGFFQRPFNFNKVPLGPVGCCFLIHAKPASHRSWDFRAKNGFYTGTALESYCCFKLIDVDTKSRVISNTVEFCHSHLSVPALSIVD
jgi:hypothetical protein